MASIFHFFRELRGVRQEKIILYEMPKSNAAANDPAEVERLLAKETNKPLVVNPDLELADSHS